MTLRRRSPFVLVLAGLVLLGVIGGAAGLAYLFLRAAPPPAVGATGSPGSSQPAATAVALPTGATGTIGPDGLDGTWTIDTTVGSFADFSSSFVGYRVNETLVENRANTAVGRTPQVSGSLVLAGSTIANVDVTADLTRLQSDDDRRDGRLEEQAIETNKFPEATFRLTSAIELDALPVDGASFSATATGELTLHGVTRVVTVPIEARLSGNVVTVSGSIDIAFADYSIERPTSFVVLSIEDHGIMEFQLHFRHG
jgi:polyisoprenoid-binding protein YceI